VAEQAGGSLAKEHHLFESLLCFFLAVKYLISVSPEFVISKFT
jgi:hypothetical protein